MGVSSFFIEINRNKDEMIETLEKKERDCEWDSGFNINKRYYFCLQQKEYLTCMCDSVSFIESLICDGYNIIFLDDIHKTINGNNYRKFRK